MMTGLEFHEDWIAEFVAELKLLRPDMDSKGMSLTARHEWLAGDHDSPRESARAWFDAARSMRKPA